MKMKKIYLFVALISFCSITAQTEKGSFMISGHTGLGFTSNTVKYKTEGENIDGPKTTSFNISPSVGYFIIENLAVGLDIDYKTVTTKQQVFVNSNDQPGPSQTKINTKTIESTLAIIPNATYFFSKGKARPYISAGIGFANIKQEGNRSRSFADYDLYDYYNNNNNGIVIGADVGLAYFLSKAISLDLGVGYAQYNYKDEDVKVKSGAIGVNIGVSVFLK
jgi:outer membrane protein